MSYILEETETSITTLSGYMVRYAIEGHTNLENQDDAFGLIFDIDEGNKETPNSHNHSRYSMEVRKKDEIYKSHSRMESLSFITNGKPDGHASISGVWMEDSPDFTEKILKYYWANKDKIIILGSSPETFQRPKDGYKLIVSDGQNDTAYMTDIVLEDPQNYNENYFNLLVYLTNISKTTNYKRELLSYHTSIHEIRVYKQGDINFNRPGVYFIYYSSKAKSGSSFKRNKNGEFEEQIINYGDNQSWSPEHLYGKGSYFDPVLKHFFDNKEHIINQQMK